MKKTFSIILALVMFTAVFVPSAVYADEASSDNSGEQLATDVCRYPPGDSASEDEPPVTEPAENTAPAEAASVPEIICAYPTLPTEEESYYADLYGKYEVGEVSGGYKLCYKYWLEPPWEQLFEVTYGKYTFFNFTCEGEKGHGFTIEKGYEVLMLSEAFERGISDIDTVVGLIRSRTDLPVNQNRIVNIDEVASQISERFKPNYKFKLIDLGAIDGGYRVYYNYDPERALCEWALEFKYKEYDRAGYIFHEYGGQLGWNSSEDLGLFVAGYGEVFNLDEARKAFGSYGIERIVERVREYQQAHEGFLFSFWIEKVEPSPEEFTINTAIEWRETVSYPATETIRPTQTEPDEPPTENTEPSTDSTEPADATEPTTAPESVTRTVCPTMPAETYTAAAPLISLSRRDNTMTVKAVTKTVKAKKLRKSKLKVKALSVRKARGEVVYKKLSGSKRLTISRTTGKITIKKGTGKGTYKIKVRITAKGNTKFKEKVVTKTVKIRVK